MSCNDGRDDACRIVPSAAFGPFLTRSARSPRYTRTGGKAAFDDAIRILFPFRRWDKTTKQKTIKRVETSICPILVTDTQINSIECFTRY